MTPEELGVWVGGNVGFVIMGFLLWIGIDNWWKSRQRKKIIAATQEKK